MKRTGTEVRGASGAKKDTVAGGKPLWGSGILVGGHMHILRMKIKRICFLIHYTIKYITPLVCTRLSTRLCCIEWYYFVGGIVNFTK